MRVLIVGGGKVGAHLALLLLANGIRVKVIEMAGAGIDNRYDELPGECVIFGNGTDPAVLESAGVRDVDIVAAVTGSDETNLVVTTLARFEYGAPRTIARIKDPRNAWMFTPLMGVDVALSQADLMAHLIAEEMSLGNMMTLLKLQKGKYSLVEEKVHPDAIAAWKQISELPFPPKCILAAVIRRGELIIPHGDTVLQPDDEILAVVHASETARVASILEERKV